MNFYIVVCLLFLIIFLRFFSFSEEKTCFGQIPITFVYKTLKGDIRITYIGNICLEKRYQIYNSIKNSSDIIIENLASNPVTSKEKSFLKKRGWLKINYLPLSIYQAADIERKIISFLKKEKTNIISSEKNLDCKDKEDCKERFKKEGCSSNMLKDCPLSCNSCGVDFKEVNTEDSCVLEESKEFYWLL